MHIAIFDRLHIGLVASKHKSIVADRLDLQIIIEIDQPCDLLIRAMV